MSKVLTPEDIAKMSKEEKLDLASRMYSPLRCGGAGYDENGKYYLILGGVKRNAKEINDIIREMNPRWSDEDLKPFLKDEDEDKDK
jgi:hypothetical protein